MLKIPSDDIHKSAFICYGPLFIEDVHCFVNKVQRTGQMGSGLMPSITFCCRPLGCLFSDRFSVPVWIAISMGQSEHSMH